MEEQIIKYGISQIIKYGISNNYIPDWGYKEAYREVLQNFIDYGEYKIDDSGDWVFISNSFIPNSFEFLKIGFSQKNNSSAIGKHGEGLKMAMLVFKRLKIDCYIRIKENTIDPIIYKDEILGDCFGLKITKHAYSNSENNFEFVFKKTSDYLEIKDFIINKDDILFENHIGRIVNKEVGSIYVGGLYVTKIDNMSYAYDLNPKNVNLGRDRSIPSTFDVEWYCSKIQQDYLNSIEDLEIDNVNFENRDYNYIDDLPDKIVERISPIDLDGNIEFAYNGKTLPSKLNNALMSNEVIKDKIEKVRIVLTEKKSPYQLLKKFYDENCFRLDIKGQQELNHIVSLSINWEMK